jgi:hypothetical protein
LEVRILKKLRKYFAEVRILKELRTLLGMTRVVGEKHGSEDPPLQRLEKGRGTPDWVGINFARHLQRRGEKLQSEEKSSEEPTEGARIGAGYMGYVSESYI